MMPNSKTPRNLIPTYKRYLGILLIACGLFVDSSRASEEIEAPQLGTPPTPCSKQIYEVISAELKPLLSGNWDQIAAYMQKIPLPEGSDNRAKALVFPVDGALDDWPFWYKAWNQNKFDLSNLGSIADSLGQTYEAISQSCQLEELPTFTSLDFISSLLGKFDQLDPKTHRYISPLRYEPLAESLPDIMENAASNNWLVLGTHPYASSKKPVTERMLNACGPIKTLPKILMKETITSCGQFGNTEIDGRILFHELSLNHPLKQIEGVLLGLNNLYVYPPEIHVVVVHPNLQNLTSPFGEFLNRFPYQLKSPIPQKIVIHRIQLVNPSIKLEEELEKLKTNITLREKIIEIAQEF